MKNIPLSDIYCPKNPQLTLLFRIMRISIFFLFFCAFSLMAKNSHSQNARVTINRTNVQLESILNEIESQTDYLFIYRENIDVKQQKSIHVIEKPVSEVLATLLPGSSIKYKMEGNHIILIHNEDLVAIEQNEVKGLITDEDGEPLVGVTVLLKGASKGTVTDIKGEFSLVAEIGDVLQISYIGYAFQEIKIKNYRSLHIVLYEDVELLEEVVVVGYGTQKKVNLTGSVGTMDMKDVANRPIVNSSNMLAGKIAGVYAMQSSGNAGDDGAVIRIRGVGTLNNSDPLVLIDGFPGSLASVNPQDIESVSVLKDASSAAIYGNRAANGVVLVTTKKGHSGKVKVNYTGYWGVQSATALPKLMNSVDYCTLHNEFTENAGMQPMYSEEVIAKYAAGNDPLYPNINYYDEAYRAAQMQNHHISLLGGAENLHFAGMFGYVNQEGIMIETNYEKYDFRMNFDAYFLKDRSLRISGKVSGDKSSRCNPYDDYSLRANSFLAPILPLKNIEGEWCSVNGETNYFALAKEGSKVTRDLHHFNGQLEAAYRIWDGLSAEWMYAYDWSQLRTKSFKAGMAFYNLSGGYKTVASEISVGNRQDTRTVMNALLRYEKTFNRKHTVNALAGYSEEEYAYFFENGYRKNLINNSQPELNLGDVATQTNNSGREELGLQSFFGRIGYIYADKYLFEANVRYDGSSRFGDGHKWGTFPSFSIGWRTSEEKFMQNIKWLTNLKIRASWGKLGNQNINSYYAAINVLSTGNNYSLAGNLKPGVATTSLANTGTKWETTTQTNVGIDLGVGKNWNFTLDYFYKKTDDILVQIPIPITMGGLTAPYQNVGQVDNKGFEFSANWVKQLNKDLNINTTFNISHIKNEVKDLHGRSPIIAGATVLMEGEAINSLYGYKVDGLYQISDFTWQDNSNESIPHENRKYILKKDVVSVNNFTAQPGDLKYRDLDGDGIVTMEHDRTVIGKQFPDFIYSLQTNIIWKNFDCSIFFQGVQGLEGYQYFLPFDNFKNTPIWFKDRWAPSHTHTSIPRLVKDDNRNLINSETYVENASYLRLKNIEIGYTLPRNWLNKIGISNVRIYGNIQNAFTITNFRGYDPERPVTETGVTAYPQTRIYSFGVNLEF